MAVKEPQKLESTTETYTVLKQIAIGGAGIIYLVGCPDGKQWAAKLLDPKKVTSDKRRRFKNELSFCLKSHHPNIIKIHDHGLALLKDGEKAPFYVMPVYTGTLRDIMKKKLDPQIRLRYFIQVLHGIDAAHKKGVVHRDIKPENVLYDSATDQLVISDFGIAHFAEEELFTAVETRSEQRLANFVYAAPEQKIRGAPTDSRVDIFALGLILNELFTGVVPHGTGFAQIGSVVAELSYLDPIVEKMTRNNAADRFATVDSVLTTMQTSDAEFATRQKISQLSQEVVPINDSDDPLIVNPPKVIGHEYSRGRLTFTLSTTTTPAWVQAFMSQGSGLVEFLPQMYQVSGNKASVTFDENHIHLLRQIINQLEGHVEGANVIYKRGVESERERPNREEKAKIQAQLREQEKSLRIQEALKRL